MKNFEVAQSEDLSVDVAVNSIKEQLSGIDASLVLFFASTVYSTEAISKGMAEAFPGIRTVGCTTAGEMGPHRMGNNSVVAMAWDKKSLKSLNIEVLENIKNDERCVSKAFASFEKSLQTPMKTLDPDRYVGIVLIDGLSNCEEMINDKIGNQTNVTFLGGSAADDFTYKGTYLYVDGCVYTNAAVLMLMEPTNGYAILKTQSFTSTEIMLVPTKVDEKRRMVIEFNGRPATEVFAESIGVAESEVVDFFGSFSLGLIFDEENYFIRTPQFVEDKSIVFACSIKEGLNLAIMKSRNIVEDTKNDLEKAKIEYGPIQMVIDFYCSLRNMELKRKDHYKEYSELYQDLKAIGFATYGESYIGHMNQTSTMLLLK